jgi:hypothetical protein
VQTYQRLNYEEFRKQREFKELLETYGPNEAPNDFDILKPTPEDSDFKSDDEKIIFENLPK